MVSMDSRANRGLIIALVVSAVVHLCATQRVTPDADAAVRFSPEGRHKSSFESPIWLEVSTPSPAPDSKSIRPPVPNLKLVPRIVRASLAPRKERQNAVEPGPSLTEPPPTDRPRLATERQNAVEPGPPPTDPIRTDQPRLATMTPWGALDTPSPLTEKPGRTEQVGEQNRVSSRVGAWLTSEVGVARVRGGLLDSNYGQLGADLRTATKDVPRFVDTNSPRDVGLALLDSLGAGGRQYATTGAPYNETEGRLPSIEVPSALAEAVAKGSPDAQAMAQFLAAGARLQEFADGRAGLELYVLVELRQLPSGAVESTRLLRPSGLAPFDAWVMERSRKVAETFSPNRGSGIQTRPRRSVWRFDGIILYRRKLDFSSPDGGGGARAVVGIVTMAALSALSTVNHETRGGPDAPPRPLGPRVPGMLGRLDEEGALDVVDLTNPVYDCIVRLVEAD